MIVGSIPRALRTGRALTQAARQLGGLKHFTESAPKLPTESIAPRTNAKAPLMHADERMHTFAKENPKVLAGMVKNIPTPTALVHSLPRILNLSHGNQAVLKSLVQVAVKFNRAPHPFVKSFSRESFGDIQKK